MHIITLAHKNLLFWFSTSCNIWVVKLYKNIITVCDTDCLCSCSYHRYAYGLGEHYNSVVPKAETNIDNEEDGFK